MRLLALFLAMVPAVAGCVTTSVPPGPVDGGFAAMGGFRLDCSISNWADRCTAHASPNDSPSKAEIDITANPRDPLNVFVASKDLDRGASNCVWSVGQVTRDGGANWTTVYVGGTRQDRMSPSHPLFGWECVTDPILAFDDEGVLYYPLQAYNVASGGATCPLEGSPLQEVPVVGGAFGGCGSSFFLAVSRDGGETFPEDNILLMALAEGGLVFHDYPRMAVNPSTGSVCTVWNAVGSAGINPYVVCTRDQGRSVDRPAIVAAPDAPRGTAFASGFAAAGDGTWYMTVSIRGRGGGADSRPVFLATSTDDARSFGGFTPMFDVTPIECPLPNTEFRCGTSIELAVDQGGGLRDGRIYAVWDDGRNGDADIYASFSDDAGRTWGDHVRVNQDNTTHAQWMARVDVGPDGTVHVLYLDRRHDPGDRLYDATHAWSSDGGLAWHNRRLTGVSSDGDLGVHQNGFPFIGDYVGIDAVGGHVWMGFPSTATGRAEIAVAHALEADTTGGT